MPTRPAAGSQLILWRQRRAGLRIALAVAASLTFDVASGAVIPFLGPVLAAQFLVSGTGRLPLSRAIALVGVMLAVGQLFIILTGVLTERPLQLITVMGVFYFVCFYAHVRGKGGPVIFFALVVAIMIPLLNLVHKDLDSGLLAILVQGCLSGVLWSWFAHAVLPDDVAAANAPPPVVAAVDRPVGQALANTVVLLGAMTFCLTNSAFSTALVIPITIASLLLQLDLATTIRAAVGLIVVNLLGGLLASLTFAFVELRPQLLFLFLAVLLVGLILGGRAVSGSVRSGMFAGALTTFLILLGTGISPLPTSTPESFSTRITYVLLAIAYALCMTILLWPGARAAGTTDDGSTMKVP